MNSLQESLSSWATVLGTAYNLIILLRSGAWLPTFGILLVGFSTALCVYAFRERTLLETAGISIGGRSLDSLNAANLRRRVAEGIVVQEAHHTATVSGPDLHVVWEYAGYSASECVTKIEFSIDADNNIPFDELDCFAYDLRNDPNRQHRIRPILISSDGISKKVAVPLLEPLSIGDAFALRLECALPDCMNTGVDYVASTLSFKQAQAPRCTVRLVFVGNRPSWVRVYNIDAQSRPHIVKDLRPVREDAHSREYVHSTAATAARSATVYTFLRSAPPR